MSAYDLVMTREIEKANNSFRVELLKDIGQQGEYIAYLLKEEMFSLQPAVINNGVQQSARSETLWVKIKSYAVHSSMSDIAAMDEAVGALFAEYL